MAATFRGSYSVTVTPFTADRSAIDVDALQQFMDWQVESGVPGVIVLGTTGEYLTVSDEERALIVETAVKQVAGRARVLVGTMNAHTPNAVRYSKQAEELGADGLMVLPPYYYTPTDDEIWRYYRAISEAVSVPIMLYNNPVTANVDMSAALVARLTRDFENIRYIKESSQDLGPGPGRHRSHRRRDERLRRGAASRLIPARGRRLRQPVRQLRHQQLPDLGPAHGGPAGRGAGAAADHRQDRSHHRGRAPHLRAPVLFQGPGRGGRAPGRRCPRAAHDVRRARRRRTRAVAADPAAHRGIRPRAGSGRRHCARPPEPAPGKDRALTGCRWRRSRRTWRR